MNIGPLPFVLDVAPLQRELAAHPEVWNEYRWRTEHPRSPHRDCSDIWCRYNAPENFGPHFNAAHESVWYPVIEKLPAARDLTDAVMGCIDGEHLAGVLITKVPAGKQVYPHADRGWHAESFDKFAVLIEGNREQSFCFEGAEHRCEPGECFTFCNQQMHWVLNPTDRDRVTLIVCARRH